MTLKPAPTRTTIRFTVDGTPAPQGSKTTGRTRTGTSYVREDNPNLQPWRNAVVAKATQAMNGHQPLTGPLYLEATFRFARPQAHYRTGKHAGKLKPSAPFYCATRPDLDKLLRAVGDAITGIVCRDDAQLGEVYALKTYGAPGLTAIICELGA